MRATPLPFDGRTFSAFLFDMDGTILTSIAAAERVWTRWAERHGLDVAAFLPTMHGVRAIDTIRRARPDVDAEAEAAALTLDEIADVDGVEAIGGAVAFLSALPSDRWAIVTSATLDLAMARLGAAGIVPPKVFVTAELVTRGKPKPDGYLLAAKMLGRDARDCLVFEDAPAGIEAGEAAGACVAVVTATHAHPVMTRHFSFARYDELELDVSGAGLRLSLIDRPRAAGLAGDVA